MTPTGRGRLAPSLFRLHARPHRRARLVCFPYGGGGPGAFRQWSAGSPDWLEVVVAEMAGRGTRAQEPLEADLGRAAAEIADDLGTEPDLPLALFGHSLGGLVAFEVVRQLRRCGAPEPVLLVVSGSRAPQVPLPDRRLSDADDDELLRTVVSLGGVPDQVLAEDALVAAGLPALRADLALVEDHQHVDEPPLTIPFAVMGGADDRLVPLDLLEPWVELTDGPTSFEIWPGDHFFAFGETGQEARRAVHRHVERALALVPAPPSPPGGHQP